MLAIPVPLCSAPWPAPPMWPSSAMMSESHIGESESDESRTISKVDSDSFSGVSGVA